MSCRSPKAPSAPPSNMPRKRSLILAGGGLKVAFQAGVMQVWLDEAELKFDHADGASGGCFNLAMYCQGMSGKQIADNWRTLDPAAGVSLNWQQYARLFFAKSLFTMDAYRTKVFTRWGLDWKKIRTSRRRGDVQHLQLQQAPARGRRAGRRWMKTTSAQRSRCPCFFRRSS